MIIFHIVTPPLLRSPTATQSASAHTFSIHFMNGRTVFTMKGLHWKADSCCNQSLGRSEVAVERSVFLLRIAISNLGPQTGSITLSRQAAGSSSCQKTSPRFTELKGSLPCSQQPTAFSTLSQINPAQDPHSCSWKSNFNIILPFIPKSSTCLFPPDFPIKSLYAPLSFPLRATFPVILRFFRGFPQSFRANGQKCYKLGHKHFHSFRIHYTLINKS